MCVIIFKAPDVAVPTEDHLKQCWDRNPDGAGYAVWDESAQLWHVRKGFMKWKAFKKAWKQLDLKPEQCAIIHFRIKSAGKVSPGNTHPFPIVDNYQVMRKKEYDTTRLVFHNGTCGAGDGDASDTMVFVKTIIEPLYEYMENPKIKALLSSLLEKTHDRWLIADGSIVTRYGVWHEDQKRWYSNTLWKPVVYSTYKPTKSMYGSNTGDAWDDDYDTPYWGRSGFGRSAYADDLFKPLASATGTVGAGGKVRGVKEEEIPDAVEQEAPSDVDEDRIVMCPNCYEDKYLDESPFVGQGDTLCIRCGAIFDEGTDKIYMFDEDMRKSYEGRIAARMRENSTS